MATPIFDHAYPITIKVAFSLSEYVLAWKKSARSGINLIFQK